MRRIFAGASRYQIGRVAQTFDLAGTSNAEGAPSFASFAKGGTHKRPHRPPLTLMLPLILTLTSRHNWHPGFDLAGTSNAEGAPSFASFAKGGTHKRPQHLMFLSTLPLWNGHSCPLPLTLGLMLTSTSPECPIARPYERLGFSSATGARATVEERRFSAA
jgi:hypothetical protein